MFFAVYILIPEKDTYIYHQKYCRYIEHMHYIYLDTYSIVSVVALESRASLHLFSLFCYRWLVAGI